MPSRDHCQIAGFALVQCPLMSVMWMAAAAGAIAAAAGALRRGRARRLARLRANWGQPIVRTHRMDALAAAHRSRLAAFTAAGSLDERTWRDLLLDEVFAAIDR